MALFGIEFFISKEKNYNLSFIELHKAWGWIGKFRYFNHKLVDKKIKIDINRFG